MIIGLEAMTVADFVSREWLSWAGAARGCAVHCKPWAWAQGGEGFPAVVTFGKQSQWKSHPVLSFGEMLVMVRSCEASKSSSSHFPLHYCNKTDSSPWLSPSTFNYLSFTENFSSMWRLKWTRLFLSVVSQYCCAYALAKSYMQDSTLPGVEPTLQPSEWGSWRMKFHYFTKACISLCVMTTLKILSALDFPDNKWCIWPEFSPTYMCVVPCESICSLIISY